MGAHSIEEAVLERLRELAPGEQEEVLDFATFLAARKKRIRRSLYGLWKDVGVSISEEDISAAREEMLTSHAGVPWKPTSHVGY